MYGKVAIVAGVSSRVRLATARTFLAVGTRFRGNETLTYQLALPPTLIQVDADPLATDRSYPATMASAKPATTR